MDTNHGRSPAILSFLGFFNLEFSFYFTVEILVAVAVEGDGGTEKVGIYTSIGSFRQN